MGNQIINKMLKLKSRPMMDEVSSENFELVISDNFDLLARSGSTGVLTTF